MGLLDRLLGPPNPDRFARMLIADLKRAGDKRLVTYDPEMFCLTFSDQDEEAGTVNLANLYSEFCNVPRRERRHFLRQFAKGLLSTKECPEDFQVARSRLLPVVRTLSFFESSRLQQQLQGKETIVVPYQQIGDHLAAAVVYDQDEAMVFVTKSNLATWGISHYEAMEEALHNIGQMDSSWGMIGEGVHAAVTGDTYDSSRLLLADFIRALDLKGDAIALVPNRNALLITGAEDVDGLGVAADLAEQALDDPRPISAVPLRLHQDGWATWMPEATHPCFNKFRHLEIKSIYSDYADQKRLLDALFEKQGIDLFVATYSAAEKEGHPITYCVWAEGVDALLPRTDKIAFMRDEDEPVAFGDWQTVQEAVGEMMQPLEDYHPPRLQVKGFPNDEQLRAIGKEEF